MDIADIAGHELVEKDRTHAITCKSRPMGKVSLVSDLRIAKCELHDVLILTGHRRWALDA